MRRFLEFPQRFHRVLTCGCTAALLTSACAPVPQYQRVHLADPTMQLTDDPLGAQAMRKLHGARESASGGDGKAAGGGCGCAN